MLPIRGPAVVLRDSRGEGCPVVNIGQEPIHQIADWVFAYLWLITVSTNRIRHHRVVFMGVDGLLDHVIVVDALRLLWSGRRGFDTISARAGALRPLDRT